MDYDYKHSLKRSNEHGLKKIRLALIFAVVAGVTALVIWKTLPDAEKKTLPALQKKSSSGSAEKGDSGSVTDKESGTAETQRAASASAEAEEEAGSPASSGEGQGASDASAAEKSETESKEPDVQKLFPKGQESPGDIPAALDKPLVPAEKQQPAAETDPKVRELEQLLAQKKFSDVSKNAENLLASLTPGSTPYRKILSMLADANWARFIAGDVSDGFSVRHTVSAGEYLGRLSRRYKTTVQAVMLANKLKSTNIMIGQKLCFLPGSWKISVLKEKRLLLLFRNGRIFMGFDVGVGRQNRTPSADFVISDRLKHPVYRTSDGRVFKHGEPGNELGDYFLKLAAAGTPRRSLSGYGIHGTPDEASVTRSLSNGCIRMRNRDVMKLYHIVPSGTPVEIKE